MIQMPTPLTVAAPTEVLPLKLDGSTTVAACSLADRHNLARKINAFLRNWRHRDAKRAARTWQEETIAPKTKEEIRGEEAGRRCEGGSTRRLVPCRQLRFCRN